MDREALSNIDWPAWVSRWDRMQEGYLVARDERFAVIARLVRETQGEAPCILDLGCGTGSLMAVLLEAIPGAQVLGLDLDPTLLPLAEKRLSAFGSRGRVDLADLTRKSWLDLVTGPVNAAVSATALHWLSPDQLAVLYSQVAGLLSPGGIFLNADHVASDAPVVQAGWVRHRDEMCPEDQAEQHGRNQRSESEHDEPERRIDAGHEQGQVGRRHECGPVGQGKHGHQGEEGGDQDGANAHLYVLRR